MKILITLGLVTWSVVKAMLYVCYLGIGYLRVAVSESGIETVIWSQSQAVGNNWVQGKANIGRISKPFNVSIKTFEKECLF